MEQDQVSFDNLGLSEATLAGIRQAGFQSPSPIQAAFIPIAITGADCIGQAQTGTGKTAAFVLPILERIDFKDTRTQVLVLTPTRDSASRSPTKPSGCRCIIRCEQPAAWAVARSGSRFRLSSGAPRSSLGRPVA